MSDSQSAKFGVGSLICHRLFAYRGVIVDVDGEFSLSEEWYRQMARSQPPRDAPWYHVLVDGASHQTYVAERNLRLDTSARPVRHPAIERFFTEFEDGRYWPRARPM